VKGVPDDGPRGKVDIRAVRMVWEWEICVRFAISERTTTTLSTVNNKSTPVAVVAPKPRSENRSASAGYDLFPLYSNTVAARFMQTPNHMTT
jgi:hypothetical protein